MSSTADLVTALKAELKQAGITYAMLAVRLGVAESTIKRTFAKGDMPLSRIDEVLRVLKMDFAELARTVAEAQPMRRELTREQEAALVADDRLLLVAMCCLSQWTLDQILATYRISEADVVKRLAKLDHLGVIELRPLNRYRLRVAKTFRFRPGGPLMTYFRERVVQDYFNGGFDAPGELLLVLHGQIGNAAVDSLNERLTRVAQDFATQHAVAHKLPANQKRPYTMVVGMRCWLHAGVKQWLRQPGQLSA
jgi:lambda repressor-like predicted transcriptional regulator